MNRSKEKHSEVEQERPVDRDTVGPDACGGSAPGSLSVPSAQPGSQLKRKPLKGLKGHLLELDACAEAKDWARGKTAAEAWESCERADWLLWWAARTRVNSHQQIVLAACACARTAEAARWAAEAEAARWPAHKTMCGLIRAILVQPWREVE